MAYVETREDGMRRGRYKVPGRKSHGSTPWMKARESIVQRLADDEEAKARQQGAAYIDPRRGQAPFGEFAQTFMKRNRKRAATLARRRWLLRTFLLPRFEFTPVGGFNWAAATEWADSVHTHSERTVRQALSLLSTILTAAVDAQLIAVNPIYRRVWAGRVHAGHSAPRVWSYPAPVIQIADRMGHEAQALMILIAQFTGMRYGEICALRRDNVLVDHVIRVNGTDHVFKVLRVDPDEGAWHEDTREDENGREYQITYLGPPKSQPAVRDVFLPPFLVERIERWLEQCPFIYPFSTPSGTLWLRSNWSKVLRPAADGRAATPDRTRKPSAWQRIAADILSAIDDGSLKPGRALPTLAEQAERYRAARATAQKAVDWLAAEGVADTRGWRTYVANDPVRPAPPVTVVAGTEEWDPLVPGWGLHGGRHWCKSAVADGDSQGPLPKVFADYQFGHAHPGIDGVYTHILLRSVQRFTALMQREWERAFLLDRLPEFSQSVQTGGVRRRHTLRPRRSSA